MTTLFKLLPHPHYGTRFQQDNAVRCADYWYGEVYGKVETITVPRLRTDEELRDSKPFEELV